MQMVKQLRLMPDHNPRSNHIKKIQNSDHLFKRFSYGKHIKDSYLFDTDYFRILVKKYVELI